MTRTVQQALIKEEQLPETPVGKQQTVVQERKRKPTEKELQRKKNTRLNKEIKRLQAQQSHFLPYKPMRRLCLEITQKYSRHEDDARLTRGAIDALRTISEEFITELLGDGYLLTQHAGRVTLQPKDVRLTSALKH